MAYINAQIYDGVPVNHRLSQMGGRGSGHDAVSDGPVHSLKPGQIIQQSI
jgi:hypothetical protein